MQQSQGQTRLHYLDNLRALAMLAGLFFHAALAYSPMAHALWPSADPAQHQWFDLFAWASHLFRMPLFFLLAGFFAALLWQKSGGVTFMKNRLLRVALPLLIFLPLLYVAIGFVIQYALNFVQYQSPFLRFIKAMMEQPEQSTMPLSTMHLWFLYHLLFLYLLTWCARILLQGQPSRWLLSINPQLLLLMLTVACLPALYVVAVPFPAPEWILPALWALWFYGLFFALGYSFFKHPQLLQNYLPHRHAYLLIGAVSYGCYYVLLPLDLLPQNQPQELLKFCLCVFEAITAVLWTLAAMLYARQYLNFSNQLLRYCANTSYWVYIIHLPLLFLLQFLITDLPLPIVLKFLLSSFGTLALCLLSFHLLVSWSWLARMLTTKPA